jgi:hypothetical protein
MTTSAPPSPSRGAAVPASQAIAAAAARIATGASNDRRELRALKAVAAGPMPDLATAADPGGGDHRHERQEHDHATHRAHRRGGGDEGGMTNSDGIYIGSQLVEAGDWTGFGGPAGSWPSRTSTSPVLETARGGILLRGIGYAANDVAVVTNVSADHLGLQGIDTLDELAEVKGAVARITKRSGWVVLNADDPRAWRMRRETKGQWYPFTSTREPEHRARPGPWRPCGRDPARLAGAARRGSPAAAAGARRRAAGHLRPGWLSTTWRMRWRRQPPPDALGISPDNIAKGLRSFALDRVVNPGRLNPLREARAADPRRLRAQRGRPGGAARGVSEAERGGGALLEARSRNGPRGDRHRRATDPMSSSTASASWPARPRTRWSSPRSRTTSAGRESEEMNEIMRAGVRGVGLRRAGRGLPQ